jgi:hypothetical protein
MRNSGAAPNRTICEIAEITLHLAQQSGLTDSRAIHVKPQINAGNDR